MDVDRQGRLAVSRRPSLPSEGNSWRRRGCEAKKRLILLSIYHSLRTPWIAN
jgi:hypothetical protein